MAEVDAEKLVSEGHIKWILGVRRERRRIFGDSLFSDPAWDILLELLAARLSQRRVALADLSGIAPSTTVARWVAALEERGLVLCEGAFGPDQMSVALSPDAAERMISFLGGAPRTVA